MGWSTKKSQGSLGSPAATSHLLSAVILGNMSSTAPTAKFAPGDRVAERPKACFIEVRNPDTLKRISPNRAQRFGTVLGHKYQVTKNGRQTIYVEVRWDKGSSAFHAQSRLCFEQEFSKVVNDYCAVSDL